MVIVFLFLDSKENVQPQFVSEFAPEREDHLSLYLELAVESGKVSAVKKENMNFVPVMVSDGGTTHSRGVEWRLSVSFRSFSSFGWND